MHIVSPSVFRLFRHVCMYVCMYVYIYKCRRIQTYTPSRLIQHVYVNVYMYIYIYIYTQRVSICRFLTQLTQCMCSHICIRQTQTHTRMYLYVYTHHGVLHAFLDPVCMHDSFSFNHNSPTRAHIDGVVLNNNLVCTLLRIYVCMHIYIYIYIYMNVCIFIM